MKRIISLLLATIMAISALPLNIFAEDDIASASDPLWDFDSTDEEISDSASLWDPVSDSDVGSDETIDSTMETVEPPALYSSVTASGTCGENLTWELTSRGVLTISGTGDMSDYGYVWDDEAQTSVYTPYPWDEYESSIKSWVIGKDVLSVKLNLSISNLESVTFNGAFTIIDISSWSNKSVTIYGYTYSTAEAFVDEMLDYYGYDKLTFVSIGETPLEEVESGSCGDNLTWTFDTHRVLTISGTGDMPDYGYVWDEETQESVYIPYPWNEYEDSIKSWVIGEDVASVDLDLGASGLESVTFNGAHTTVNYSSYNSSKSVTIYGYTNSATEAFANRMISNGYEKLTFVSIGEAPITTIDSGLCGENLTWELTSDGTLTISGTGEMPDYGWIYDENWNFVGINPAPWSEYHERIYKIILSEGITSIDDCAFYAFILDDGDGEYLCFSISGVTSIDIPASVKDVNLGGLSDLQSVKFLSAMTSIYDSEYAISSTATIYGYTDSTADAYATKYGRTFVSIGEAPLEVVASGKCGDNLTWTFDTHRILTISGTGDMYEYGHAWDEETQTDVYIPYPWDSYATSIKSQIIGKNVGDISLELAYRNLKSVTFNGMFTTCSSKSYYTDMSMTIYGYAGSTAEDIANRMISNGYEKLTFVSLGEAPLEVVASGKCGDNLTWTFDTHRVLTISGTGAMYEYGYKLLDEETQTYSFTPTPWGEWIDLAKKLVVENGVTELSDGTLYNNDGMIISEISSIYLPASLTKVCEGFDYLDNLNNITLDKKNETYAVVDNVLYTKDMSNMIVYPRGKESSHYSMPDTVQQMGQILYNHNIESLVLSRNLISFEYIDLCGSLSHITFLNPNTVFPDWEIQGMAADYVGFDGSVVIYGFDGSTAQQHAQEYDLTFVDLTEKTGDLTHNGEVDRNDAIHLLYNSIFGNEDYTIYQDCDYNGDGVIDRSDAIYLLYHSIFPEDYPL